MRRSSFLPASSPPHPSIAVPCLALHSTSTSPPESPSTPDGSGSQAIEAHRAGAEVYRGAALCGDKSTELLVEEVHLPLGLLPLADMEEEVGYSRSTGFVWLRPRKPLTHTFRQIGRVWMTRKKRKRLKPRRPSCKRCGAAVL